MFCGCVLTNYYDILGGQRRRGNVGWLWGEDNVILKLVGISLTGGNVMDIT